MKKPRSERTPDVDDGIRPEPASGPREESPPVEVATPAGQGEGPSEPVCAGIRDLLGSFSEQTGSVFS